MCHLFYIDFTNWVPIRKNECLATHWPTHELQPVSTRYKHIFLDKTLGCPSTVVIEAHACAVFKNSDQPPSFCAVWSLSSNTCCGGAQVYGLSSCHCKQSMSPCCFLKWWLTTLGLCSLKHELKHTLHCYSTCLNEWGWLVGHCMGTEQCQVT